MDIPSFLFRIRCRRSYRRKWRRMGYLSILGNVGADPTLIKFVLFHSACLTHKQFVIGRVYKIGNIII